MNKYNTGLQAELIDRDRKFSKEIEHFNPSVQYSSYRRELYYMQMRRYLSELVFPKKFENSTVIELGSGSGKATFNLNPKRAVLVDISPKALEFADLINKSWYKVDAQYIQNDFLDYQDENRYDVVFNIGTLEHYDDESIICMIQKMISLVGEDGYVCFGVPNKYSGPIVKAWFLSTKIGRLVKGYRLDSERFFTNRKMKSLIQKAVKANHHIIYDYKVGYIGSPCLMESSKSTIQNFDKVFGKYCRKLSFLKLYSFKISLKNNI